MQPHDVSTWERQRKIPGYEVGMDVGTTVMGYD